jgi:hypothetical protein
MPRDSAIATNLALGALAGAVGVWALDRVDWSMWNRESPETRARTRAVRPYGLDPARVIARRAADLLPTEATAGQIATAGNAIHFAIGVSPAIAYGALRPRLPWIAAGRGSLFGLSLFLLKDEGLNTLLKLGARPQDYPWQDHARGIVAHTVYGLVVDTVLSLFQDRKRD